jgi:hypothetical protein
MNNEKKFTQNIVYTEMSYTDDYIAKFESKQKQFLLLALPLQQSENDSQNDSPDHKMVTNLF